MSEQRAIEIVAECAYDCGLASLRAGASPSARVEPRPETYGFRLESTATPPAK
ncbi:MAG TPA: hypothetical protein VF989_02685 [Polyangiaceae bacterium]|jgi:hypothetical protein